MDGCQLARQRHLENYALAGPCLVAHAIDVLIGSLRKPASGHCPSLSAKLCSVASAPSGVTLKTVPGKPANVKRRWTSEIHAWLAGTGQCRRVFVANFAEVICQFRQLIGQSRTRLRRVVRKWRLKDAKEDSSASPGHVVPRLRIGLLRLRKI